jgi:agmatine/peptidylarginine deiminase
MSDRFFHAITMTTILLTALLLTEQGLTQTPSIETTRNLPLPPARLNDPPPGPVHCIAEWEESEGVFLKWKNYDLINKIQAFNKVYIPVDDQAEKDQWIVDLTNHGIPLTHIEFLFIKTDSRWTRDYGPWFIWDGDNKMGIVNYTSGFGPNDDLFPLNFATLYGIPYYESGIHHVGGNWYPNGYGTAFSSTYVYEENGPALKEDIDRTIETYWGIENYHTASVAPFSLEHLDCWAKPANPETLLVAEFPDYSAYYPFAESLNRYYETLESPWGRPYRIIRLPMFKMGSGMWYEFKPYMNSLVSNQRVYVPICFHPDDAIALAIFQEAFPGYEIVGVDHYGTGHGGLSVHCSTRNFHKREVLRIYPYPPGDTEDTLYGYSVHAEVIPPDGTQIATGYPLVYWTDTGGAPFHEIVMTPTPLHEIVMTPTPLPNTYETLLPAKPLGTTLSFYIEAKTDTNITAVYPLVAPGGLMEFKVREDQLAPVLSRFIPTRCAAAGQWPPKVRTLCKDDMATPDVRLEYAINGVPQTDVVLEREHRCYWYGGTFGGSASADDLVTYRLVAEDFAASANKVVLPKYGKVYCPVVGPGSVAVVDLSTCPETAPFIKKTLGELGVAHMCYSTWPLDWDEHDVWFIILGIYANNHVLTADQANDIVAALQNGKSIYLESNDAWCFDPEKDKICPYFGVIPISDGVELPDYVYGVIGTLMEGVNLFYAGENAFMDKIDSLPGAEVIIRSDPDDEGRMVLYDAGSYKTVASTFSLGRLWDEEWPDTRKNVLLKILGFFGIDDLTLYAKAEARQGTEVPLRLEADPGDGYRLFASFADFYLEAPGYGAFRLDPNYLFTLVQGVVPPSGVAELSLPIPRKEAYLGTEIHLQAVAGSDFSPGEAHLTNREILTIVE